MFNNYQAQKQSFEFKQQEEKNDQNLNLLSFQQLHRESQKIIKGISPNSLNFKIEPLKDQETEVSNRQYSIKNRRLQTIFKIITRRLNSYNKTKKSRDFIGLLSIICYIIPYIDSLFCSESLNPIFYRRLFEHTSQIYQEWKELSTKTSKSKQCYNLSMLFQNIIRLIDTEFSQKQNLIIRNKIMSCKMSGLILSMNIQTDILILSKPFQCLLVAFLNQNADKKLAFKITSISTIRIVYNNFIASSCCFTNNLQILQILQRNFDYYHLQNSFSLLGSQKLHSQQLVNILFYLKKCIFAIINHQTLSHKIQEKYLRSCFENIYMILQIDFQKPQIFSSRWIVQIMKVNNKYSCISQKIILQIFLSENQSTKRQVVYYLLIKLKILAKCSDNFQNKSLLKENLKMINLLASNLTSEENIYLLTESLNSQLEQNMNKSCIQTVNNFQIEHQKETLCEVICKLFKKNLKKQRYTSNAYGSVFYEVKRLLELFLIITKEYPSIHTLIQNYLRIQVIGQLQRGDLNYQNIVLEIILNPNDSQQPLKKFVCDIFSHTNLLRSYQILTTDFVQIRIQDQSFYQSRLA